MPELPEVETVKRGLEPVLLGARFERVEQRRANLRFPFPDDMPARLHGKLVERLERRSKYLLVHLNDAYVLVVHLGMSGRVVIDAARRNEVPGKHDHVIFHMSNGKVVTYNDARRFGFMQLIAQSELNSHALFCNLGVEPLEDGFDAEYLAQRARDKKTDLKAFLMDQRVVAGLGNIYVCEALFRAGLSPRRKAATLMMKNGRPSVRAERLVTSIRSVLREAIKSGGSTLRDHRKADGSLGYFQHAFRVYGRENADCASELCNAKVSRIQQSGRSTFYCGSCQS